MPSAIYYPHTRISNVSLIKTALLLWDSIESIVPNKMYDTTFHHSKDISKALEIVGRKRVPTSNDKKDTHKKIKEFISMGLPKSFYEAQFYAINNGVTPQGKISEYLIYPDKFDDTTWYLLRDQKLAEFVQDRGDYRVPPAFGFLMMSMLADSCAGSQLVKVTDRIEAYNWLAENTTNTLGGKYIPDVDASIASNTYDRLLTLSVKLLDEQKISFKKLLDFREREIASSSADYRNFRNNYLKTVNKFVATINKEAKNESDVKEIEKQYEQEMESDLKELRRELNLAATDVLLSKEVGVAVLALAGSFVEPISMSSIGVGALIKTGIKYTNARRDILKKHPMSWLYINEPQPKILI